MPSSTKQRFYSFYCNNKDQVNWYQFRDDFQATLQYHNITANDTRLSLLRAYLREDACLAFDATPAQCRQQFDVAIAYLTDVFELTAIY